MTVTGMLFLDQYCAEFICNNGCNGKILNINDLVLFESETIDGIEDSFVYALSDYILTKESLK